MTKGRERAHCSVVYRAVKKWRLARACFEGMAIPEIHVVSVRFPPDRP